MTSKKRVKNVGTARHSFLSEPLEPRTMLSISGTILSGTILSGPATTIGNSWSYTYEGSDEVDNVSVVSNTTANGQPAVERDTTDYFSGLSGGKDEVTRDFLGTTSAGLVDYNQTNTSYNDTGGVTSTSSHLFEPAEVIIPATLAVGQPVTVTCVDTYTITNFTNNDQINTITRNISNTGTLVSDTTQPITVPAGTYSCYQVQQTLVWTQDTGTTTINETVYLATGVGIVEINETDTESGTSGSSGSGSSIKELSSFTGSDRLVFTPQQLPNVQAGDPIQPSFTVSVDDSTGAVQTDAAGTVTLAPAGVNADNPISGNTATLVNGVATFSDVVLTKSGVYQLTASDTNGDAVGTSDKFGVGGDKLQFILQPKDSDANQPLAMSVKAVDSHGKIDSSATDSVSLLLNVPSASSTATLAGTITEPLVSGVATFPASAGVAIGSPGTYTITAQAVDSTQTVDYSVTAANSDSFKITGLQLVVKRPPASHSDANVPIPFLVYVENAKRQLDTTDSTDSVQISLNTISGGAGANLRGITSTTLSAGQANFSSSAAPIITAPGVYTFTLTVPGSDTIGSVDTAQITVAGLHLGFTKVPHTVDIQTQFALDVKLLDSHDKVVTTESSASVALTLNVVSSKGDSPTLGGTVSADFSAGLAAFTTAAGPTFSDPGTYTLTATETGVATGGASVDDTLPGTSTQIAATRFHLELLTKPKNTAASDPFATSIAVEAANGTVRGSENSDNIVVSLNTVSGGSNAVLGGATSVQLAGGSADFSNNINASGTYTLTYMQVDSTTSDPSDATVPITSKSFKITGDHLKVVQDVSSNIEPYEMFDVKVEAQNSQNKVDTDANIIAAVTLETLSGGSGASTAAPTIASGLYLSFHNGVADLPGYMNDAPGTFDFDIVPNASDPDAEQVASVKTTPFKVVPLHEVFKQQPADTSAFAVIGGTVDLEDTSGHVDTAFPSAQAKVTAASTDGTDAFVNGVATFVNGVADLTQLSIANGGTYTLQIGVTPPPGDPTIPDPNTSKTFDVSAAHIAFVTQPANGNVGQNIPISIALENQNNVTIIKEALTDILSLRLINSSGADVTNSALGSSSYLFSLNGLSSQYSSGAAPSSIVVTAPGTYTLSVTFAGAADTSQSAGLGPIVSMPFTVT